MPEIIIRQPWRKQPGDRLVRQPWNDFNDPATGALTVEGSMLREPRPAGLGWVGNTSNKAAWRALTKPYVLSTTEVNSGIALVAVFAGTGSTGDIITMGNSAAGADNYMRTFRAASGQIGFNISSPVGNTLLMTSSGMPRTDDGRQHTLVAIAVTTATNFLRSALFIDGINYGSVAASAWSSSLTCDRLGINCLRRSTTALFGGEWIGMAAWGGFVQDAERFLRGETQAVLDALEPAEREAASRLLVLVSELDSDDPKALIWHLNQNPDLASELADLTPAQLGRRIGRIEAQMSTKPQPKPVSKAPAPARPATRSTRSGR